MSPETLNKNWRGYRGSSRRFWNGVLTTEDGEHFANKFMPAMADGVWSAVAI